MAAVAGRQGHTDARSSVQILGTCLGGRHAELALQLSDYGADHRSLLFECLHVAKQYVELEPANPHPAGQPEGVVVGAGAGAGAGAVSGAGGGGGAGLGGELEAGGVGSAELPRASNISAVRRDNCQPPW